MHDKRLIAHAAVALGLLSAGSIASGAANAWNLPRIPKPRKPVPTMVTASPEEIAAWNARIELFKPLKVSKMHRKPRGDSGQHPKFPKERVHKQHKHPLRDEHGAYTPVGRNTFVPAAQPWEKGEWVPGRRVWLAGISAQRGY